MTRSRFWIVGCSGSGKSTLADALSARTGLARLELDAVFWDADWTYRDPAEAHGLVRDFTADHDSGWVIDGNWTSRLDGLLDPGAPGGADSIVWLDHPRPLVMARIVRRTLWRGITRQELWHGNREAPSSWLKWDPEKNVIRWAWTSHGRVRQRMLSRIAAGDPVIRLRGRRDVNRWLAGASEGVR